MSQSSSPKEPIRPPLTWNDFLRTPENQLSSVLNQKPLLPSLHKKFLKKALQEEYFEIAKFLARQNFKKNNQDIFLYACHNLKPSSALVLWDPSFSARAQEKAVMSLMNSENFERNAFDVVFNHAQEAKNISSLEMDSLLSKACQKDLSLVKKIFEASPLRSKEGILHAAIGGGVPDIIRFAIKKTPVLSPYDKARALAATLSHNMLDLAEELFAKSLPDEIKVAFNSSVLTEAIERGHRETALFMIDKIKSAKIPVSLVRLSAAITASVKMGDIIVLDALIPTGNNRSENLNEALYAAAVNENLFLVDKLLKDNLELSCSRALVASLKYQKEKSARYFLNQMTEAEIGDAIGVLRKTSSENLLGPRMAFFEIIRAEISKENLKENLTSSTKDNKSSPRKL